MANGNLEKLYDLEQKNLALEHEIDKLEKQTKRKPKSQSFSAVKKETLFAFWLDEHGRIESIGEVVSESDSFFRVELYDGVMVFFGLFTLSGELRDIPRTKARIFNDRGCLCDALAPFLKAAWEA